MTAHQDELAYLQETLETALGKLRAMIGPTSPPDDARTKRAKEFHAIRLSSGNSTPWETLPEYLLEVYSALADHSLLCEKRAAVEALNALIALWADRKESRKKVAQYPEAATIRDCIDDAKGVVAALESKQETSE